MRQERAEQLNQLVKIEEGMDEIVATFERECEPPASEYDKTSLTHALMIDAILEAEFPSRPPGHLAQS